MPYETMQIVNGLVQGLTIKLGFNTTINGVPVATTPEVDFSGMPVQRLVDIFWAGAKVKAAPVIKSVGPDKAAELFNGKISWIEFLSQAAAKESASYADMTPNQLQIQIDKLKATMEAQAAAKLAEAENVRV